MKHSSPKWRKGDRQIRAEAHQIKGFRCDFRDPWGNRIQFVDLHDESLIWLLPYREVLKAISKRGLIRMILP